MNFIRLFCLSVVESKEWIVVLVFFNKSKSNDSRNTIKTIKRDFKTVSERMAKP